jgi:D-xylose transport system ATP-binding protein
VILISHNMADVMAVADRVVVLRLGRNNGVYNVAEVTSATLIAAITGAADNAAARRAADHPAPRARPAAEPLSEPVGEPVADRRQERDAEIIPIPPGRRRRSPGPKGGRS